MDVSRRMRIFTASISANKAKLQMYLIQSRYEMKNRAEKDFVRWCHLTISVLQAYSAVITEYAIPSDSVRKSTVPLQIKISTAQLHFSNRNVIIF